MADAMYHNYREEALKGLRAVNTETIKVMAVTAGYTFSASHSSVNAIAGANRVHTSGALTNKTTTDGIFDADDVTFTAVAAGSAIAALVVYVEAGTSASSTLMLYLDSAAQLPVTPNGGDIIVQWDSGANKIFKL